MRELRLRLDPKFLGPLHAGKIEDAIEGTLQGMAYLLDLDPATMRRWSDEIRPRPRIGDRVRYRTSTQVFSGNERIGRVLSLHGHMNGVTVTVRLDTPYLTGPGDDGIRTFEEEAIKEVLL